MNGVAATPQASSMFKIWNEATVGANICISLPAGRIISLTASHEGMLHLKVVRSPHSHVKIAAIRKAKALAMPGVRAVFLPFSADRIIPHLAGSQQHLDQS